MITLKGLETKLQNSELLLHTIISFTVRIFAAFATFILCIVIAQQLGVEGAGYYFLAFSIVTVLSAVSRVGLDNTIVRFVGSAAPAAPDALWGRVNAVISRSTVIAMAFGIPIALLVYAFADVIATQVFLNQICLSFLRQWRLVL